MIVADAVVIGGGPAGSVAAGFLAQAGLRVVLFERERFPRYHIGESLLSATMPVLEALGVMPAIEAAGFVRKPGGTFLWGARAEPWSFYFRDDPGGRPHAFHVVRAQFDHLLLQHAAALGAEVREAHRVETVAYDGTVNRVVARDEQGAAVEVTAPWVIDASGQQALLGRRDQQRRFDPFFKNLAVFSYFEDAQRLNGAMEGNILSAAFVDGWFWFIPLHDGTTSVGAVVDATRFAGEAGSDPTPLYERLVAACPAVAARLRGRAPRRAGAGHSRLLVRQPPASTGPAICSPATPPASSTRCSPPACTSPAWPATSARAPSNACSARRRYRPRRRSPTTTAATAPPSSATGASSTSSTTTTPIPTRTSGRRARSSTPRDRSRRAPPSSA